MRLRVPGTTPPLCQSPQPPMNGRHTSRSDELPLVCLPFCFGGQGRAADRLVALRTVAALRGVRFAHLDFCTFPAAPTPSRSPGSAFAPFASRRAQKHCLPY